MKNDRRYSAFFMPSDAGREPPVRLASPDCRRPPFGRSERVEHPLHWYKAPLYLPALDRERWIADLHRIMGKRRKRAERHGMLAGYDRTLLSVVPTPIRRMVGLWLLGLSLGLPAFMAVFR